MKRGTESESTGSDPKRQKMEALKISFNEMVPPELFGIISENLSTYSLIGDRAIHSVCHQWNNQLKANKNLKKSKEKLFADATASPDDVINVLKDEGIVDHLSFDELLQIISFHPEIVNNIIDDLNPEDLYTLGKANPDVTRRILRTPALRAKLKKEERFDTSTLLSRLLGAHKEIAEHFLDHTPLEELTSQILFDLGSVHTKIAMRIYNTPKLYQILGLEGLINWAVLSENPDIAELILNNPSLQINLPHFSFQTILRTIKAEKLINSELITRLPVEDLKYLCRHHAMIDEFVMDSQLVLDYPHHIMKFPNALRRLFNRMKNNPASLEGHVFPKELILISDETLNKMIDDETVTDTQFFSAYVRQYWHQLPESTKLALIDYPLDEETANLVLSTMPLDNNHLISLMPTSFSLGKRILDDYLKMNMKTFQAVITAMFMFSHLDITKYIIEKDPSLLEGYIGLKDLSRRFMWVAKHVAQNPKVLQAAPDFSSWFKDLGIPTDMLELLEKDTADPRDEQMEYLLNVTSRILQYGKAKVKAYSF